MHSKNNKIECPKCNAVFSQTSLPQHLKRIHHKNEEKERYKCDICEKSFTDIMALKKHMRYVHDNNSMQRNICTINLFTKLMKDINAIYV